MANWFYEHNGKPIGPITETQMQEWAKQRALQPEQLVRRDSETAWQKAGTCRELFAAGGRQEVEASQTGFVGKTCGAIVALVGLPFVILALFVANNNVLGAIAIAGPGLGFLALLIWCADLSGRLRATERELRTLRNRQGAEAIANQASEVSTRKLAEPHG